MAACWDVWLVQVRSFVFLLAVSSTDIVDLLEVHAQQWLKVLEAAPVGVWYFVLVASIFDPKGAYCIFRVSAPPPPFDDPTVVWRVSVCIQLASFVGLQCGNR